MSKGRHARRFGGRFVPVLVVAGVVLATVGGGATFAAYRYDRAGALRILPGVSIDGVDVGRMTRDEAVAAVRASAGDRLNQHLTVAADGRTLTPTAQELGVRAEVVAAVDEAMAVSGSMGLFSRVYSRLADRPVDRSIALGWRYSDAKVDDFVGQIYDEVGKAPRDAAISVVRGELVFTRSKPGLQLKSELAASRISTALRSGASGPVALPVKPVAPKVSEKALGTTVVVKLAENRLYLYEGFKLERTYSVATAVAPYETPTGTWAIVNKAENPTWTNPALDTWGADLPPSIPPGPGNPLGTRALYLNAPGIRIHGTYDTGSIGTYASHGCIRMTISDVEELYPLVPVGSTVIVL